MAASLPTTYDAPVRIALIGGTGLQSLPDYEPVAQVNPQTPWGYPSAPISILAHNGVPVAFLSRHGLHHEVAPHEVNSRANIAALRSLGVRAVIAFSAVGSLQEEIKPRDFVVVDDVIDRTKGCRPFTFFEKGVVGHVGFADPFDKDLAKECGHALAGEGVTMHDRGTLICIEGPQFSSRAESKLYRSWGGSVINMSALPEAKLAREAEMAYQMICMATDYDCWRTGPGDADVDVVMVLGHMKANAENAKRLVRAVLDRLCVALGKGEEHAGGSTAGGHVDADVVLAKKWQGTGSGMLKFMTKPEGRGATGMKNVEYLFPGIWDA